jgi:hypothetical protein
MRGLGRAEPRPLPARHPPEVELLQQRQAAQAPPHRRSPLRAHRVVTAAAATTPPGPSGAGRAGRGGAGRGPGAEEETRRGARRAGSAREHPAATTRDAGSVGCRAGAQRSSREEGATTDCGPTSGTARRWERCQGVRPGRSGRSTARVQARVGVLDLAACAWAEWCVRVRLLVSARAMRVRTPPGATQHR